MEDRTVDSLMFMAMFIDAHTASHTVRFLKVSLRNFLYSCVQVIGVLLS